MPICRLDRIHHRPSYSASVLRLTSCSRSKTMKCVSSNKLSKASAQSLRTTRSSSFQINRCWQRNRHKLTQSWTNPWWQILMTKTTIQLPVRMTVSHNCLVVIQSGPLSKSLRITSRHWQRTFVLWRTQLASKPRFTVSWWLRMKNWSRTLKWSSVNTFVSLKKLGLMSRLSKCSEQMHHHLEKRLVKIQATAKRGSTYLLKRTTFSSSRSPCLERITTSSAKSVPKKWARLKQRSLHLTKCRAILIWLQGKETSF